MTVKELRAELNKLGAGDDDREIRVWLPGTYIALNKGIFTVAKGFFFCFEGNVVAGELP